ncbi:MAG: cysteine desulfurase [Rickettsiaceae bacterium]|nr:cysteine desulfurase [Rickettsiaceae bacterium]
MSIIYLDNNATTSALKEVQEAMIELFSIPLNASSVHSIGRKAKYYKEQSKIQILNMLGLDSKLYNVVFTSSGTEANNLVMKNFYSQNIIISCTEHPSIYNHIKFSKNITVVNVDSYGMINMAELEQNLQKSSSSKTLVSIMLANNETGIIQPLEEIANLVRNYGAILYSDCCQYPGKLDYALSNLDLDILSISGHKFGAPTGVAALILKKTIHLEPEHIGGGQEYGMRSGTENIPAIVGMGVAADWLIKNNYRNQIASMRDSLESKLFDCSGGKVEFVGQNQKRLVNTSMILMPKVTSNMQLIKFDLEDFAVSAGSACSSGKIGDFRILKSMGYSEEKAKTAIRVSLSYKNTEEELNSFVAVWEKIFKAHN